MFLSFSSCSAQRGRPIVQSLGAEREKLSNTASEGQALCEACHSQGRRTDDTGQSIRGLQGRSRTASGEGGGDQANQMGGRVGLVCKQACLLNWGYRSLEHGPSGVVQYWFNLIFVS